MPQDPQAEAMALLAAPATHGGAEVRRIDTHISAVFLAGDLAFKVKKAVRLPFLDFSTLEARKAACEAELALNRRSTPDLYLEVRPITRGPAGTLVLGGEGEAVEWVVVMRRFDESCLLDRVAAEGRLDRALVHELIEAVVRLHDAAPRRDDGGGLSNMRWTIDNNGECMRAHAGSILPADKVEALQRGCETWLERLAPLLEDRRRQGRVRECHGDLHLGNVCLWDGKPTPFDGIEFAEHISVIDVAYDLAFLLMDLERRAGRALASQALNHWLDITGDYEAVAALPLFLACRAGIRAHVSASMSKADAARAGQLAEDARSYLDAALAYLAPPPARLVAVGGLSGSGKSRMGRELAPFLGVPGAAVVRTDALRKQIMGVGPFDRLGPEGYTAEVTERTYQALTDICAMVLAGGHAVVADAVFARPEQRAALEQIAARAGVRFDGLWMEAPPEVAAERIQKRRRNVSDATVEVLEKQMSYDIGPLTWTRIDTGRSRGQSLAEARAALGPWEVSAGGH